MFYVVLLLLALIVAKSFKTAFAHAFITQQITQISCGRFIGNSYFQLPYLIVVVHLVRDFNQWSMED